MSKFNKGTVRPSVSSPVTTERTPTGRTHQGGPGYARDAKSELFLLAVANFVGESTFYESPRDRDSRYVRLVHRVAVEDPDWLARLLGWLRGTANQRSAALVGAAEMARARLVAGEPGQARQAVAAVLRRADEPGELLAYWMSRYGRRIPKPIKRGVADAVRRLYGEVALLKYDTDAHAFRFGDVIDLTHPVPSSDRPGQADLFRHALDRRHGRGNEIPASLGLLRRRAELFALPVGERRAVLDRPDAAETLRAAGVTWEALAGWLQGPMDATAWQCVIPSMGYMALLRNLRNFDRAGVPDEVAGRIAARLADPDEVARSRQLPLRFLSAYRAAPSLRWGHALDTALTASLDSVPALGGRTLIMVDTSGSMNMGFSRDGTLKRWDAAALFGIALGQRCARADVVSFSSGRRGRNIFSRARSAVFALRSGESLLRSIDRWNADGFFLGGGTETALAVREHYAGHDRVVLLTDEQASGAGGEVDAAVPHDTPMVTFNLAGYRYGHAPSGDGLRSTVGGLTDAGFAMVGLAERGVHGDWPF